MTEGLRLVGNKDADEQGAKDWRFFLLRAQAELVMSGKDRKLRDDCDECKRLKDHLDLLQELAGCMECGKYQTFHYQCHYCDVIKSAYGV